MTAAVAGFDVGAGGEEEDGVRCASLVGGEVKAGAPALVEVVNGVREGDKRVLAGGDVVSASGAEEDTFAARKGDDGGGEAVGESGGGREVRAALGLRADSRTSRLITGMATRGSSARSCATAWSSRRFLQAKSVMDWLHVRGEGCAGTRSRAAVTSEGPSGVAAGAAGAAASGVLEVGAVADVGQSFSAQRQCGS